MPVKLAEMPGKKRAANRVDFLPQKAQPGTKMHYLLPSGNAPGITSIAHCRTPGVFGFSLSPSRLPS